MCNDNLFSICKDWNLILNNQTYFQFRQKIRMLLRSKRNKKPPRWSLFESVLSCVSNWGVENLWSSDKCEGLCVMRVRRKWNLLPLADLPNTARKFLGVEKGANRTICWFTPLFAEREGCKPSLLTPYIVVVYIPLRFNCSQIVAIGEYFENTHSYCCEICSLAFLGFKGTNK